MIEQPSPLKIIILSYRHLLCDFCQFNHHLCVFFRTVLNDHYVSVGEGAECVYMFNCDAFHMFANTEFVC